MQRERITIKVEVDLDPVPGAFHTPEYWEEYLKQNIAHDNNIAFPSHYNPTFEIDFAEFYKAKIARLSELRDNCREGDIEFYDHLINEASQKLYKHELPF